MEKIIERYLEAHPEYEYLSCDYKSIRCRIAGEVLVISFYVVIAWELEVMHENRG